MKYTLLFSLLLLQWGVWGQNYSCIGPEAKTYFINQRGYLRGMRIDSVKYENGNTLFFPFRTARLTNCSWGPIADTLGGSWWGKTLVQTPTGSTWMQNKWGDTITIRNDANLNDSWVFYRDSTTVYYEAQIVAWDTMTFLGLTDSVKRIRITAKDGSSVITSNPLNDLELVISKQHGWIQVVDFYLFPYHAPDDPVSADFDCYFFEANGGYPITDSNASLIFKRVHYSPAFSDEVYNYQVGDIFWDYEVEDLDMSHWRTIESKEIVTTKVVTDSFINYTLDFWSKSKGYNPPTPYNFHSGTTTRSYARGVIMMDTTIMPEEWYNGHYYYYFPEDSSYCYRSAVYGIKTDKIFSNGYYVGGAVEPSTPSESYKNHLGVLSWSTGGSVITGPQRRKNLVAAQKENNPCNNGNEIVSVTGYSVPNKPEVLLYPNPADDRLEVKLSNMPSSARFKLELYNSLGVTVLQYNDVAGQCILRLNDQPEGLYFIKIYGEKGSLGGKFSIRR